MSVVSGCSVAACAASSVLLCGRKPALLVSALGFPCPPKGGGMETNQGF